MVFDGIDICKVGYLLKEGVEETAALDSGIRYLCRKAHVSTTKYHIKVDTYRYHA
jgi:hypothetical protein